MIISIRIAFVTTHFPPENHVACRRNEAFARYFDRVRYDVHFIVPKRQNSAPWNLDGILVRETQKRSLLRPFTFEKAHSRFVHALMVFYNIVIRVVPAYHNRAWIKATVREFERLHRQESMHVLITQYGPIAPHIVGLRVKRRYPRIRWIADNRDVISDGPFTTRIAERQLTRLESAVVRTADAVTAVSGPFLERLARHGRRPEQVFAEIRNGFTLEPREDSEAAGNEVFTVRYVGSLYGGRKPRAFFEALERLVTGRRIGEVRVEITGSNPFIDVPVSLTSAVRCIGNVDYPEAAVDLMCTADALLLLHPTVPTKGIYPAKLFEYMAAREADHSLDRSWRRRGRSHPRGGVRVRRGERGRRRHRPYNRDHVP